jgi:subtilisin
VEIISYCINGEMAYKTGTSMASPHIAALAAMLRLYVPDRTNDQIAKYIFDYGVNPGDPYYYGAGIPDASCFAGN